MKFSIIHYQLLTPRFNSVSVELNFNPSPIEIHPESPIPLQKEIIHKNNFQNTFRSKLTLSSTMMSIVAILQITISMKLDLNIHQFHYQTQISSNVKINIMQKHHSNPIDVIVEFTSNPDLNDNTPDEPIPFLSKKQSKGKNIISHVS